MPCRDDYPPNYVSESSAKEHQILTRAACDFCKHIELAGGSIPRYLSAWWIEHKREDAARIAREEQARQKRQAKISALNKLTPAEREALGF